jgi:hypothetical protein
MMWDPERRTRTQRSFDMQKPAKRGLTVCTVRNRYYGKCPCTGKATPELSFTKNEYEKSFMKRRNENGTKTPTTFFVTVGDGP